MSWYLLILLGIRPILSVNEVDLKRNLLDPSVFDKTVRPRINTSHTVNVQIGVTSVFVTDLDEKGSSFSQACNLHLSWTDEFLTWNTSDYDGVQSFVIDPSFVWTPDLTVFGRVATTQEVGLSRVRVRSNGLVSAIFNGLLTTHCNTDPTNFPYDYQLCKFRLASQVYSPSEVAMEITSTKLFGSSESNPNWNRVYIRFNHKQEVHFCLQRKSLYLSTLYIAPTTMQAVLVLVSFLVPNEAGEKISFGMSLFLSFMVFLLQLYDNLPQVSTVIPALEIYFMLHMVSGVISIIVSSSTAYVMRNTNQSPQSTETKVKDESMVPEHNKDNPNREAKKGVRRCLRSMTFINRLGFVISLILILAANIVILNARMISRNCEESP
ncbi:acetylcholine receptor subunit beta-like 1 [Ostrea edulis]|uniref:acetylcholine receptor subunit beta-like 1 n=1 Tax=Ostrea edulis TaxID=37623 RepID=UPI0024AF8EF5|nr:acetylcholine receptor subunit beta-like 1 [Ostrea edulis]